MGWGVAYIGQRVKLLVKQLNFIFILSIPSPAMTAWSLRLAFHFQSITLKSLSQMRIALMVLLYKQENRTNLPQA